MQVVRKIFILIMLGVNIWFVAIPSIEKFLDQGIMIEVSTEKPERLVHPAVSFGRVGPDSV